jgi:membrane fusion protein (multidrug efflux system)
MDGSNSGAGFIALPPQAIAGQNTRRYGKRLLMATAALGIAVVAGIYGYDWWTVGRFQVDTDDAYVAADSVLVSPKISGILSQVLVQDNQTVHAGDVLARIDDRDDSTALDQQHRAGPTAPRWTRRVPTSPRRALTSTFCARRSSSRR